MTDPMRWSEADAAPTRARELFRSARPTRGMTPLEKARSAAEIARMAATPAGAGGAASFVVKNILAGLFGALGAGMLVGGDALVPQNVPASAEPSPRSSTLLEAPQDAPKEATPPDPPAGAPSPRAAPKPALVAAPRRTSSAKAPDKPQKPAAPAPPSEDSLVHEIALLEEARAIVLKNPASALDWLGEHARAYPNGRLSTEREFLAMDALLALGRKDEARARGETLLERASGSPFEARVRRKLSEMK